VGVVCFKVKSYNFPVRTEESFVRIASLWSLKNFLERTPEYHNKTIKSYMAARDKEFCKDIALSNVWAVYSCFRNGINVFYTYLFLGSFICRKCESLGFTSLYSFSLKDNLASNLSQKC
jgi:hypothetical protein